MSGPTHENQITAFIGPRSFSDSASDRQLFCGRAEDSERLLNLVLAERLVLFYGESGIGKTSLINATLLNGLRDKHFFPVVIRVTCVGTDPIASVYSTVRAAAESAALDVIPGEARTLWDFFDQTRFSKNGEILHPVLIFDQFEELFTRILLEEPAAYETFVMQLADIARGRMPDEARRHAVEYLESGPRMSAEERERLLERVYGGETAEVKILLSVREDFLPELELLTERVPGIFRNGMRLLPLSHDQALQAIEIPPTKKEVLGNNAFSFEQGVVDEILRFLQGDRSACTSPLRDRLRALFVAPESVRRLVPTGVIEPFQLQVLCAELDRKRQARGGDSVTLQDLGGPQGMCKIMRKYYIRILHSFPSLRIGWSGRRLRPFHGNAVLFNSPRFAISRFCEKGLITRTGRRNSLARDEAIGRYGVSEKDLGLLNCPHRLVRSEARLGSEFYELTHDMLIEPILGRAKRRSLLWKIPLGLYIFLSAVGGYLELQYLKHDNEISMAKSRLNDPRLPLQDRTKLIQGLIKDGVSDFRGVNLQGANLVDVNLSSATLAEANLSQAVLRGAKLVECDLTQATVEGAILSDTTKFSGTAWWLARGWSTSQIAELEQKWPHTKITESSKFKTELQQLDTQVNRSRTVEEELAVALNNRAWFRAERGVQLDRALIDARQAVEIARRLSAKGLSTDVKKLAMMLDTEGYIQLQLNGNAQGAVATLKESVDLFRRVELSGEPSELRREAYYHLGVAYEYVGQWDKAASLFAEAQQLKYVPSHELLLTPRRLDVGNG